jgi:hypothetical protein
MKTIRPLVAFCCILATVEVALPRSEPAQASPEHSALGFFEGTWNYRGVVRESPVGPAGNETHRETCEWFDGGYALVCRLQGRGPTGPRNALSILGFDEDRQSYVYFGIDNWGGPYQGYGQLEGKTWTFTYEFRSGNRLLKLRSIYVELSSTRYEMKVEVSEDGDRWMTSMEGTATREIAP